MAFLKLDTGILDSTLWLERDLRDIFLTALLMAQPREFGAPVEQIEIDSLQPTGFSVAPGWYGFVPAAGLAIISRAGVTREAGLAVLRRLGEPEAESRSQEFEGRRMIRINGGFVVLNFMRYRDHDYGTAERMRKLRERKKNQEKANHVEDEPAVTRNSRNVHLNITQAEDRGQSTEAEVQKQKLSDEVLKSKTSSSSNCVPQPDDDALFFEPETMTKAARLPAKGNRAKQERNAAVKRVFTYYLEIFGRSPKLYTLTGKRLAMGMARLEDALKMASGNMADAEDLMKIAVTEMSASDFHMGRDPKTNGKTYCEWEHVFRSAEQFQKWLQRAQDLAPKKTKDRIVEDDWSVLQA